MRTAVLPLSAVLAGALFLTSCGTGRAGDPAAGPSAPEGPCGERPPNASASPPPGPADAEHDGVRITGFAGGNQGCAAFEVTHTGSEPFTYTITFDLLSDAGSVLDNTERTVEDVAPGRTVRDTFTPAESTVGSRKVSGVRIAKVRSVPADEAPDTHGPCPASGVRVYADDGDAAMGLRVVSLHLKNCGTEPYELHGYPEVRLHDEDHEPVDGVRILRDGSSVAGGTGADGPALPLVVQPGEGAWAGLVWRNTTLAGTPVHAPYARVRVKSGADWVTVVPEVDLGTTGKLAVGPWKKREESAVER
ncbi:MULTISPECIES: DUF4232 domain-containing protein [unclassified Streptomyces]|uniref:DUF4232 domain-containing protein n=1 Tax=unclassified Streptomyces TaxID=2593676 RepID=UPI000F708CCF|nr:MULTISPECIES: DUF4232 domain-containing protein [unclassified Streptomyces]AZM63968.1 DUF4232 domain-containing protein [Streptomyces sp. WAC 01438]RSM90121.1 DUF4232 domain-containing protein [Streptomyces sp. WAC 01420]